MSWCLTHCPVGDYTSIKSKLCFLMTYVVHYDSWFKLRRQHGWRCWRIRPQCPIRIPENLLWAWQPMLLLLMSTEAQYRNQCLQCLRSYLQSDTRHLQDRTEMHCHCLHKQQMQTHDGWLLVVTVLFLQADLGLQIKLVLNSR